MTKRNKTARHCAMDEFHYSTPQEHRPLGAQALLDRVIPNHTPPRDKPSDSTDDALPALIDISNELPPPSLHTVTDQIEHTITANAAQLLTVDDQREILHLDASFDTY
jgi:hypothetical protein